MEESGELRELLRLFRRERDAPSKGFAADAGKSVSGFELVKRIGIDGLQRLLTSRLTLQLEDGQSRYQDHEFLDALQSVLWAIHAPSSAREGDEYRTRMFVFVLQAIHEQSVPPGVAAAVTETLLRELQHLKEDGVPPVVEEILRGVTICHQQQQQRRADGLAIFFSLELLPQLLMRVAWCPVILLDDGVYDFPERCSGAEYKDQVMGKLLALAWPKRFFLQFLKTFRDFSMSDEHERDVCAKLYREANGEINVHSPDDRANNFELLPTVFHNVLLLALRTKNEVCKRLLIHLLMQQCALLTREGSTPSDYVQERSSSLSRTHSVREIRGLQATILYHLDIVIKQDPSMVKIFLVEYEAQSESLTPFDVAVMLTISSAPQGARVSGLLCHQIVRSYLREVVEDSLAGSCRNAFLQAIPHAMDGSWSAIPHRMVSFGFQLIQWQDKKAEESLENASTGHKTMHLPWVGFGIRLIIDCFRLDVSVRERVIDGVVNGIIVQDSGTKTSLLLLARIVQRHPVDISGALAVRVREGFEYLIHMTPKNAQLFLYGVGPLLKARPNMKGFLILTLRKAMFRKDEASRIIGIKGLSFLLCLFSQVFKRGTLTQLYSQNTGALLSQGLDRGTGAFESSAMESQNEVATQEQSTAITAENLFRQFCGIFKRAFQLQTSVRLVLYAELVRVFRECPALQPSILDLIYSHFLKYYDANDSVMPPLKLDSCVTQRRGTYEEPLAHLMHLLLTCIDDIKQTTADDDDLLADDMIPATQTPAAQQSFGSVERAVSSLMRRMKHCEISDFEFDKNVSFTSQSPQGEMNRQIARMLCDVLEVSMNWVVSSRSGTGLNEQTWEALAHYLHLYHWIAEKLAEADGNGNGTERKRGRPSKKAKQAMPKADEPQIAKPSSSVKCENSVFFCKHAGLKDALLLTTDSIVAISSSALAKVDDSPASLTKDDELLLLFTLERAARAVNLVQESSIGDFQLLAHGASLSGHATTFIDRLGPILFRISEHFLQPQKSANQDATTDRDRNDRWRKISCSGLQVFGGIVSLWMNRPAEDAIECIGSVCRDHGGDQEEDDFGHTGSNVTMEKCTLVFLQLFDSLTATDMMEEAAAVLDIIKTIWWRFPKELVTRSDIWMKGALTRRKFSAQRLLDSMVQLFVRPQPQASLNFQMCMQIANGLLYHCNGESELPFRVDSIDFTDRLSLDALDEKNIATVASALLTRTEQAMMEVEALIKEFCAKQQRQALKLREEEANLLQAFEDENGASALDVKSSNMNYQATFKNYCRRLFELSGILMPFGMMDLTKIALSLRVIRVIGRLYKLLVALVMCKLRRKESTLPKYLQRLFDRTAGELSPVLLQFIACIHEEAKRSTATKVSKKGKLGGPTASQSKLIPEVIYQMEQFDLTLIKLSKLCKGRDFSQWCKLRQSRDFRFNRDRIHERIHDNKLEKERFAGVVGESIGEDELGTLADDQDGEEVDTDITASEGVGEAVGDVDDEDEPTQRQKRGRGASEDDTTEVS